jgi:hypothetical protein
MALFGGSVILRVLPREGADLRWLKWTGLALVMATGLLLFASQPVRYYGSASFKVKLALLTLIGVNALLPRRSALLSLVLWAAVILAARGIAFY